MITFKQYLVSEHEDSRQAILEQAAALLKRDCQPFLQASGKKLFFRGMDPEYNNAELVVAQGTMYKVPVRKDREPKDSPPWLHEVLNDKMVELTGRKVRSQCLFAVGDIHISYNYGAAFAVFPIGDFDYVWSKQVVDPSQEFYLNVFENGYFDNTTPATKKFQKEFIQHLKKSGEAENFKKSANDIASWVHKFDESGKVFIPFVESFIMQNDFWIYNQDLQLAGTAKYKEHEVMFLCDHYYALNVKLVDEVMKKVK